MATIGKLLRLTGPIALSEVLWGMSTFVYAVVFTRLGTSTLAASQIVLSLENIFIVASAGLAPCSRCGNRASPWRGLASSGEGQRMVNY